MLPQIFCKLSPSPVKIITFSELAHFVLNNKVEKLQFKRDAHKYMRGK